MVFAYKNWEQFCRSLKERNIISIPVKETSGLKRFFVLKHDIENNVSKAYKLAKIENKYGHRGSYYAHAYLLDDPENVLLLSKMQEMGHEISYHYDVMDSNKGDIDNAISEFKKNVERFEALGFPVSTVCQHGNPVVERIGYTSNRDFFRSERVQQLFPELSDIMVDYQEKYHVKYSYFSDAGRKFTLIFDPINNDIVNSDDKNIPYPDLNALLAAVENCECAIISTHPHRWTRSAAAYVIKSVLFKFVRSIAKIAAKIPFFKKIMSKYYYLAKKI